MNQRFVATIIVALAVLFSQGGGSVLAAICPHLRSQHNASCHEAPQDVSAGHHEMDHDNGEPVFEMEGTAISCNHCAVHSRTKPDDSALPQVDTLQRPSDLVAPIAPSVVALAFACKNVAWTAKAHGPPGSGDLRYVLNSTFRI
jgi:hypothetical protein